MNKKDKKEICFLYGTLYALKNGMWLKTVHSTTGVVFCNAPRITIRFDKNKEPWISILIHVSPSGYRYTFYSTNSYNHKWGIDKTKLKLGGK